MSGSKISLSLGSNRRAPPPTNGVKRPRAALRDEEDDVNEYGRIETVSHFDRAAGGAIDEARKKQEKQALVIPRMANRDWRDSASKRKRQKSGLPGDGKEGNMDQRMADVEAADAAKKPGFGLNLYKKQENGEPATENGLMDPEENVTQMQVEDVEHPRPKTEDDLAMDALLGKTTANKNLTIPAQAPMSEADAFQHDYIEAPDMATLDDYARVPVEDFGAAMLRGMGWKEGEGIGSQKGKRIAKSTNKLPERRANLLGIGAKEDTALAQEMGAWGKAAKGGKEVKIYNPVLLRDKKTGEMYTEEELQKKRENDERAKYEEEFEKKEREWKTRRQRDNQEDRDSRDHRREREIDRGDRRDRERDRRKYDDESDDERYRRKEKDRRRRHDKNGRDGDYDYERSRRHKDRDDSDRDRHRDRDRRDRDRDRDRRR